MLAYNFKTSFVKMEFVSIIEKSIYHWLLFMLYVGTKKSLKIILLTVGPAGSLFILDRS